MQISSNRPYPFVGAPGFESGGIAPQRQFRLRLSVRWIRDDEGKLICRWGRW